MSRHDNATIELRVDDGELICSEQIVYGHLKSELITFKMAKADLIESMRLWGLEYLITVTVMSKTELSESDKRLLQKNSLK